MNNKHTLSFEAGNLKIIVFLIAIMASFHSFSQKTFIITSGSNYMAHRYNESTSQYEIFNATAFSAECVWYSTNTNHYYFEGANGVRYYASSEFNFAEHSGNAGGTQMVLTDYGGGTPLSTNTTDPTYYYNWDHGLAHGKQYRSGDPNYETFLEPSVGESWECYWVIFNGTDWVMSSTPSYEIVSHAAIFEPLKIANHPVVVSATPAATGGYHRSFGHRSQHELQRLSGSTRSVYCFVSIYEQLYRVIYHLLGGIALQL